MKYNRLLTMFLCLVILVNEIYGRSTTSSGTFGRTSKSQGSKDNTSTKGGKQYGTFKAEASKTSKATAGGLFLSAWGIIWLILFVIVGSALTYYVSIFYPIVCAKRGKYDVMEMTAV